jgi:shikimate kinase
MKRIFFIGYMGAGKSHAAKLLAEASGRRYVDLDDAVELAMGQTIQEAFQEHGEAHFRRQEAMVLSEVVDDASIAIVACGGGTPCAIGVDRMLGNAGHVVHLDPSIDVLIPRLLAHPNRPFLESQGRPFHAQEIQVHWKERQSCYSFAHERLTEAVSEQDLLRWMQL